jgi:hypothetical protein
MEDGVLGKKGLLWQCIVHSMSWASVDEIT